MKWKALVVLTLAPLAAPAEAALPSAWFDYQITQANATIAGTPGYGNEGQRAAIAYTLTKDEKYAHAAVPGLFGAVPPKPWSNWGGWQANWVRQYGWQNAYLYGLIRDALTADEREWCEHRLRSIAYWINHDPRATPPDAVKWWGGWRTMDGDQTAGQYVALLHIDRVLGTTFLADTATGPGGERFGVPGLVAREHLRKTATVTARGGEWDESTEYNLNTVKIVLTALMLADGRDLPNYPEFRAWAKEAAALSPTLLSPDRRYLLRWGDTEQYDKSDLKQHYLVPYLLTVHAASGDVRPLSLTRVLFEKYKLTPAHFAVSGGDWLWLLEARGYLDPAAIATAPAEVPPSGVYTADSNANGKHVRAFRGAAAFHLHVPGTPVEDHWPAYGTDFGWYDGTDYHQSVLGYGDDQADPLNARDATAYGLGAVFTIRDTPEVVETPSGVIVRGGTGGPKFQGWNHPPGYATRRYEVEWAAPGSVRVKNTFAATVPPDLDKYLWPGAAKAAVSEVLAGRRPRWQVPVLVLATAAPVETAPGVWAYTTPGGVTRTVTATGHASAAVAPVPPVAGALTPTNVLNRYRIVLGAGGDAATVEYRDEPTGALPPPPPPPPPPPVVTPKFTGTVQFKYADGVLVDVVVTKP